MKQFLCTLAVSLFATLLFAQEPLHFKGLTRANGAPLAAATVSLLKQSDSSLVKLA